jgi:ATP/maltotriose-dependent transcriptional regulator MalT
MCRQASHFARQGETEEAMRSIAAVRSRYGVSLVPEVAVWLMLAEGILSFSSGEFSRFTDRVKRAHGIARASNYRVGRAACAAWLALSSFNDRRYEEMIDFLTEAFQHAAKDDHQARARASLVLADALHLSGKFEHARPWYEATRQHALAEGDEATLSAMLFNVASFRASNVKFASALGDHLEEEARRATLEATSAAAFDHAIGTKSFNQFLPHLVEQLLIVEGKYKEAFEQLESMDLSGLPAWGYAAHYADYATCAWELGKNELVKRLIPEALAALNGPVDPDDAAYACCRLASVVTAAGDAALAATLRARAQEEAAKYRSFQIGLAAKLLEVSSAASRS